MIYWQLKTNRLQTFTVRKMHTWSSQMYFQYQQRRFPFFALRAIQRPAPFSVANDTTVESVSFIVFKSQTELLRFLFSSIQQWKHLTFTIIGWIKLNRITLKWQDWCPIGSHSSSISSLAVFFSSFSKLILEFYLVWFLCRFSFESRNRQLSHQWNSFEWGNSLRITSVPVHQLSGLFQTELQSQTLQSNLFCEMCSFLQQQTFSFFWFLFYGIQCENRTARKRKIHFEITSNRLHAIQWTKWVCINASNDCQCLCSFTLSKFVRISQTNTLRAKW